MNRTTNRLKMELFSLSLLTGTLAFGQMANAPNRVPSVSANHLINYDKGILKLTDFKGKFVILEFWSPTCISCLEGFPRLDSLQRAFDGRIQIILVNQANKEETVRFFQTHPRVTRPSLPFITGDRVLNANFPHQGNPATAVLDTSGKMICMPANINSNNIKLLLEGRPNFKLMQKQIYVTSLFDERWQDLPEYYSYVARTQLNLHLGSDSIFMNGNRTFRRVTQSCTAIADLYRIAFDGLTGWKYQYKRRFFLTNLDVPDSASYVMPSSPTSDWLEKNAYNYQLQLPIESEKETYQIMKSDLDRYFGLETSLENRKITCLVLEKIDGRQLLLRSHGGEKRVFVLHRRLTDDKREDSVFGFNNVPYASFSLVLGYSLENIFHQPFIDSVRFDGTVDFTIDGRIMENLTIPLLQSELRRYGLTVSQREIEIPVILIRKKQGYSLDSKKGGNGF